MGAERRKFFRHGDGGWGRLPASLHHQDKRGARAGRVPLTELKLVARAQGARDKPSQFGDLRIFAIVRAKISTLKI